MTALVVAMVFCTAELRVFILTFFLNVNCLLVQGNYQHFYSFCCLIASVTELNDCYSLRKSALNSFLLLQYKLCIGQKY